MIVDVQIVAFSKFIVKRIESIHEIFQALDVLNALKLANSASNFFSINFIDSMSNNIKNILPCFFLKVLAFPEQRDD